MKSKLKKLYYLLTGRFDHIKKGIKSKCEWYGNGYGGFYVIPRMINNNSVVYSFGIGMDVSFDKEIISKHGCMVYGFDPTPKSIAWVKNQVLPTNFKFFDYGISDKTGIARFNLPKNKDHVSGSTIEHSNVSTDESIEVKMKSFTDIISTFKHKKVDILKMDIEGTEYDILDSILQSDISIAQIVIEFHERFFDDGKQKTIEAIKKLNEKGYEIFAISDSFEEISFVQTSAL